MSKLIFKLLLLSLLFPLGLYAFTIEGKDGWEFEVSKGFMKKHISANIKDKTAKTKFVKRWKKGHQANKKSTILLKADFVNAVKKMKVEAKDKLVWISLNGKTVYTEKDGSKVTYKCEDVNKVQIQQEVLDKTSKKMKLFHIEKTKSSKIRNCKG